METHSTASALSNAVKAVAAQQLAWVPTDFDEAEYVVQLSPEEVIEVESALESFKKLGLDGDKVSRDNFPLPTLQARLRETSLNLYQTEGRGFCIIRGLDATRYSAEDNVILYLAIANHVGGEIRGVQDRSGNVLIHITDNKQWTLPFENRRGIHTNRQMTWHNDMGADILALHVRQCAERGGSTYVASVSTLCLDLLMNHRDVLEAMLEPTWPIQTGGNPPRYVLAPLLQYNEGKIMMCSDPPRLGRQSLTPAIARKKVNIKQGFLDAPIVPDLTAFQRRALDTISSVASKYRLRLDAKPGDMIFINNWAILHARDAYVDESSDNSKSRHMVRLWLRHSDLAWGVPATMNTPWEAAFGVGGKGETFTPRSTRGGWRRVIDKRYPILPGPDYRAPKYSGGSAAYALEDDDEDEDEERDVDTEPVSEEASQDPEREDA